MVVWKADSVAVFALAAAPGTIHFSKPLCPMSRFDSLSLASGAGQQPNSAPALLPAMHPSLRPLPPLQLQPAPFAPGIYPMQRFPFPHPQQQAVQLPPRPLLQQPVFPPPPLLALPPIPPPGQQPIQNPPLPLLALPPIPPPGPQPVQSPPPAASPSSSFHSAHSSPGTPTTPEGSLLFYKALSPDEQAPQTGTLKLGNKTARVTVSPGDLDRLTAAGPSSPTPITPAETRPVRSIKPAAPKRTRSRRRGRSSSPEESPAPRRSNRKPPVNYKPFF